MVKLKKEIIKGEIPIFFSTDDNYVPFMEVAIRSLIANASKNYKYKIIILNAGLKKENTEKVELLENENFQIEFADISSAVGDLKQKLPNQYHFGLATWYRLFIQSLFPQYDKVLYLDCDIVVLGDISKLYFTDLEGNTIAGSVDKIIMQTKEFADYTKYVIGVDAKNYINAGIMILDLKKFREQHLEENFVHIINKYNCDVVDPDQGYINFLCKDKIKYIPTSWNRPALEFIECENPNIIHYNLYKKPWQYDDVYLGEYFWKYAKESPFYEHIKNVRDSFDDEAKAKKEAAGERIKVHCIELLDSENTFVKRFGNSPLRQQVILEQIEQDNNGFAGVVKKKGARC